MAHSWSGGCNRKRCSSADRCHHTGVDWCGHRGPSWHSDTATTATTTTTVTTIIFMTCTAMLGHVLAIRGAGQWRDPRQRCGGTNTCRFATWALELGCGARQHGPHSHAATFSHTLRHQHSAMMPAGAAASTTSGANAMWRTRANSWHMICFRGEVACVGLPELFPAHAKKLFLACPGAAWALFRAVMGVLATGLEHGTLWRLACGCWQLLTHAPRGCARAKPQAWASSISSSARFIRG